jgi:hypothetical protein
MHDPIPLARTPGSKVPGHGSCARYLAGRRFVRAAAILHSQEALQGIQQCMRLRKRVVLPLPMHPPRRKPCREEKGVTVRVLGQYKADRDVGVLERLAVAAKAGSRYEIVGRGWGPVPGWKTIDRFVPEQELIELIQTSDAIVIPYRRFYQSDIAVRSLEGGTPVVGPEESSLKALVGTDSGWLATDDWEAAAEAAVEASEEEVLEVATRAHERARDQWRSWLAETCNSSAGPPAA